MFAPTLLDPLTDGKAQITFSSQTTPDSVKAIADCLQQAIDSRQRHSATAPATAPAANAPIRGASDKTPSSKGQVAEQYEEAARQSQTRLDTLRSRLGGPDNDLIQSKIEIEQVALKDLQQKLSAATQPTTTHAAATQLYGSQILWPIPSSHATATTFGVQINDLDTPNKRITPPNVTIVGDSSWGASR